MVTSAGGIFAVVHSKGGSALRNWTISCEWEE
jgi:hypothetical protein